MPVPVRAYSIYKEGYLILIVRSLQGQLRRAGMKGFSNPIKEIPFADCLSFSPQDESVFINLIDQAKGLDDFLFKLKLEGFELRDGEPTYDLPYGRW